jgi:methionyl-tRNA synthetase
VKWGVRVDFDPAHVAYVWIDALFNYMTALGYQNSAHDDMRFWPADAHIIGKDIVRFHSIIWPAFLMALELPLPKKVFGHGFVNMNGEKLSKSTGNVVDPYVLAERYGADALRFFLLRTIPYGSDGDYANELLINCINTDLANNLGNLVSRTVAMIGKYFGGALPGTLADNCEPFDRELLDIASALPAAYDAQMDKMAFHAALAEVFRLASRANKYIDETTPWTLSKNIADSQRLARVLYNLLESIRFCAVTLSPFMPETAEKILAQIGAGELCGWESLTFGNLPRNTRVTKGETLFPRISASNDPETPG